MSLFLLAFLFGAAGLGLEVVGTALLDYPSKRDPRLPGYSSPWYLPFYAVAPLAYFHFLGAAIFPLPFYVRGAVYLASFWAIEYAAMGLLRLALGKSPSEESYYKSRWHVHGLIRLDLGPAWLALLFTLEWMYRGLVPSGRLPL